MEKADILDIAIKELKLSSTNTTIENNQQFNELENFQNGVNLCVKETKYFLQKFNCLKSEHLIRKIEQQLLENNVVTVEANQIIKIKNYKNNNNNSTTNKNNHGVLLDLSQKSRNRKKCSDKMNKKNDSINHRKNSMGKIITAKKEILEKIRMKILEKQRLRELFNNHQHDIVDVDYEVEEGFMWRPW